MTDEERYDSLFRYYGEQAGIDWLLLKAQVKAESNFKPDALSKAGAAGLSQFMKNTWREWRDGIMGISSIPEADSVLLDPRDPEDAIKAQASYMAWLKKQVKGDIRYALAAYNWGIGKVHRLLSLDFNNAKKQMPKETQNYVARVTRYYQEYISESTGGQKGTVQ